MADKTSVKETPKKTFFPPLVTLILTILIYGGSQIAASLVVLLVPVAWGWGETEIQNWLNTAFGQFLLIGLIEASIVGMLYWLLKRRGFSFRDIGLHRPKLSDVGHGIIGFGIYFLLYVVISVLVRLFVPSINFDQQQQVGFEAARGTFDMILVFLSLVVMPPFVEELFARGFIYTGFKTKWPKWLAVVGTSLLFAAAHLQFGSGAPLLWVAAIDTFTLSLVLIYLREKTGGLAAPMTLHMLKNGIAFVILFVIG